MCQNDLNLSFSLLNVDQKNIQKIFFFSSEALEREQLTVSASLSSEPPKTMNNVAKKEDVESFLNFTHKNYDW